MEQFVDRLQLISWDQHLIMSGLETDSGTKMPTHLT